MAFTAADLTTVENAIRDIAAGKRVVSKIWSPGSLGPNNSILNDLNLLRERSRDATRNNAWVGKGINSLVSNEIGTGIVPRSLAPDKAFRKKAEALWEEWSEVADADGVLDIYGLMALALRERSSPARSLFESGSATPLSKGDAASSTPCRDRS